MIIDGHNDLVLRRWRGETPWHVDLETAPATGFAGPVDEIVHHVEHVADRIGDDHLALVSDFEGATVPEAPGGAAGLPGLAELLHARFGDESAANITQRNWLRALEAPWRPWGRYFDAAGADPRP